MVQATQRKTLLAKLRAALKLRIFVVFKRLEAKMAILSMNGDRKIKLTGELPEDVVLGFVQPFALRQNRISYRHRAQLLHCPTRLFNHLAGVASGQDRHEF